MLPSLRTVLVTFNKDGHAPPPNVVLRRTAPFALVLLNMILPRLPRTRHVKFKRSEHSLTLATNSLLVLVTRYFVAIVHSTNVLAPPLRIRPNLLTASVPPLFLILLTRLVTTLPGFEVPVNKLTSPTSPLVGTLEDRVRTLNVVANNVLFVRTVADLLNIPREAKCFCSQLLLLTVGRLLRTKEHARTHLKVVVVVKLLVTLLLVN